MEMPRIQKGHFDFNFPLLGKTVTEEIITDKLKHAKSITNDISLFKMQDAEVYLLIDQSSLQIIGIMELEEEKVKLDKCQKVFSVDSVEILDNYRRQGLGEKLYIAVLKRCGGCLMTDQVLHSGSEKLWKKLIKKYKTVGWDMKKKEQIEVSDDLFGTDLSKKDLRVILLESPSLF